jgi:hypothetical protein
MVGFPGANQRRLFCDRSLVRLSPRTIDGDRYPLSPRIVALKEILGQLRPEPEARRGIVATEYVCSTSARGRYRRRRD